MEGAPPKWISNYDGRFKGLIPIRQALAESRNAVAIWMTSRSASTACCGPRGASACGRRSQRFPTTALGASEMNLLELANAYRTMASGIVAEPYVIRSIVRDSGEVMRDQAWSALRLDGPGCALAHPGRLRGVVRLPTGTAHALASRGFPFAVMGKTGTTNEFRDAIFVGLDVRPDGITAAVRIGFDDNRSLERAKPEVGWRCRCFRS